jgi:membrane fusion protein (multidrug efflux system)
MNNQQKHQLISTVALITTITLVAGGCRPHGPRGPQQMGPPEVSVITVKTEQVALTTELPGRTTPYRVAQIRPQVNGLILKRAFKEGSDVKAGDLLYQIDPAPYQAAYDQARAAVAMAEANLPALRSREKRFKDLVAGHAVGQQDYDDAAAALRRMEAQLDVSKAAMESAKINLAYTPIKAPISGRIGRSSVTEGALVTAYQPVPLATIQQLDPIYVDVTQSTVELLRLKRNLASGQLKHDEKLRNKVTIIQEDGNPYPLEGTLEFRDITVDPTTGSVVMRIVVPNPDGALLPGMFVRSILKEGINEQAILIPQQAVNRTQNGAPFVWIVDQAGTAVIRMLTLDRAINDKWLVSSGLAVGDQVIIEGIQRLRPGTPVKVVPQNAKAAGMPTEKQANGGR